jgi:copper chaperone NosL
MNNKTNTLSVTSRILVAFASGALIAVFFLPAWRIDLFAPQYPEGLIMNIWINGLSGDVDIINGLNHYIGMKHITVDMFPEFKFLPYVVGFFMLLGMVVSITGNRKFLLAYLVLTVIGGVLAMYDFYKWGYDYGHKLDPTAPIEVPGLSYQPPLFGHKRILNFDAYSFPGVGGWIVIAAAGLAFTVWFFEWYKVRKEKKKNFSATALLIPLLIFVSCSTKPEPFKYGQDNCYTCKMGIIDPKYGGETITAKGKIYKFDDVICMVRFLKSGVLNDEEIKQNVVINFVHKDSFGEKENDFIDVKSAGFFVSSELKSPMGSNAAAFTNPEAAKKFKGNREGQLLNWEEVYSKIQ